MMSFLSLPTRSMLSTVMLYCSETGSCVQVAAKALGDAGLGRALESIKVENWICNSLYVLVQPRHCLGGPASIQRLSHPVDSLDPLYHHLSVLYSVLVYTSTYTIYLYIERRNSSSASGRHPRPTTPQRVSAATACMSPPRASDCSSVISAIGWIGAVPAPTVNRLIDLSAPSSPPISGAPTDSPRSHSFPLSRHQTLSSSLFPLLISRPASSYIFLLPCCFLHTPQRLSLPLPMLLCNHGFGLAFWALA
ncbi:hypothetical protein J3F83DRAFT_278684 [Trichoderma novae-zelandiae]